MSHPEALLNELKGSLFEYLVARELARSFNIEGPFLLGLSNDYQKLLERQDMMVREFSPNLPQLLFAWSKKTAQRFLSHFSHGEFNEIRLAGQFSHHKEQGECDFEIKNSHMSIPVSLKLNKKLGMVNTKSGGVKSFYQNYFSGSQALQERFNLLVESEHSLMRDQLFELMDLPSDRSWETWRGKGLSELPGEQSVDVKEVLHSYYARLSERLQKDLEELYETTPNEFREGLLKLLGFSSPDLTQLICFHEMQSSQTQDCEVLIHTHTRALDELKKIQFRKIKQSASVEIELKNWLLQIRIKPMNKFTTTAIKINCSVKY